MASNQDLKLAWCSMKITQAQKFEVMTLVKLTQANSISDFMRMAIADFVIFNGLRDIVIDPRTEALVAQREQYHHHHHKLSRETLVGSTQ